MKKLIFLLVIIIGLSSCSFEDSTTNLKATISFTGTQFVIKNNDNFNYPNATLKVNDKFVLKGYDLKSGETYTVGMMQFADDDGNRFNMMKKPQNFSISCTLPDGKMGWVYAEWK